MLSLSSSSLLRLLRSLAEQAGSDTGMLPAVGTAAWPKLRHDIQRFFDLTPEQTETLLPDSAVTLDEWARSLSAEAPRFSTLWLYELSAAGAFSFELPEQHPHDAGALCDEAKALQLLLGSTTSASRTVIHWLSPQTVSGFMFTLLLPEQAGWRSLSLFDYANALHTLMPGDAMVTSAEGWHQLAQRLPALPMNVTAIATEPLAVKTYRTLLAKGVSQVIELHCQPEIGVVAARRSQQAPFELLPHWHPTESDDVLLCMMHGEPKEVTLSQPLYWVGGRHFLTAPAADKAPERLGRHSAALNRISAA
ncbi:hypothetical protein QC823_06560 [Halomonas vilamensis]|uniref:Uncharacterized protein n=1 Tax=Vreelandella vilamensis TaxID=531309 RepID=A0ABU1H2X8_9GAMM|nr:hypothetical protein [Halomonas vilamensis]MDR5898646.1 hypothetical protein [Halomonas vilamensis]